MRAGINTRACPVPARLLPYVPIRRSPRTAPSGRVFALSRRPVSVVLREKFGRAGVGTRVRGGGGVGFHSVPTGHPVSGLPRARLSRLLRRTSIARVRGVSRRTLCEVVVRLAVQLLHRTARMLQCFHSCHVSQNPDASFSRTQNARKRAGSQERGLTRMFRFLSLDRAGPRLHAADGRVPYRVCVAVTRIEIAAKRVHA